MMQRFFFNGFKFLTSKQKAFIRENQIFVNLLLFLSSMFEYKDMDESINTDFIEFYNCLTPQGCCGIFKNNNGTEILGYCTEGGAWDAYGIPTEFNINTLNQNHKEGVIDGVNAAICWNNKTHTSDLAQLSRYAELFNLVDTSQKCLLKYARLFPVFEIDNEQVKQQLEQALKNADNGEPFTYVNKGLSRVGIDGETNLKVLQLGDISAVDKIQYLSTYYNDLLRRFFTMYGMTYAQSMKAAQQSIEEIHSDVNSSWIIPIDRLNQRKKFIETYNTVFNHNASVDFSPAWKKAYTQFLQEVNGNEEMESDKPSI